MKSEKQYKHIEDKIIAAADAAEYAFNEAYWKKMEALLDKKDDRRSPFFWIFGFVLLGAFITGGAIMYHSINTDKQSSKTTSQADDKKDITQNLKPAGSANTIITDKQPALPEQNTSNSNAVSANTDKNKDVNLNDAVNANLTDAVNKKPSKINGKYKIKITNTNLTEDYSTLPSNLKTIRLKKLKAKNDIGDDSYYAVNKNIYKGRNKFAVKITVPKAEEDARQRAVENKTDDNADSYVADVKIVNTEITVPEPIKNKTVNKPDTAAKKTNSLIKSIDKKEKKKKKFSGFYLLAAAGAEASSTKLFSYKNSSIAPRYGFALGYRLNRRFSVQAGFYASAKKYIAGPNDYTVKAGSYLSTVKIIKVDANCMVYEIPVMLQYNWLIKPKTNYYAAVGLSSYIMKKEKYNYTFERNYMQYSYPYDYTKNSHLFASLQLSLGMEKQIGRKLNIQVTPTVNIPLQGVGEGSVKIFTTGLQVGLKYFPFKH